MNPRYYHKEERKVERFTVTANSCEATNISVIFKDLDIHKAKMVAKILEQGFRDVDIVSQETGEVAYRHYVSSELFNPILKTYGAAIASVEHALSR